MTGVGGGVITHAAAGVDICQERPSAGQGHVDNQTGLKHYHVRSKILLNQNQRWFGVELILLSKCFYSTFSTFFSRAANLRDMSFDFNLKESLIPHVVREKLDSHINKLISQIKIEG